jgi:tetratricopeptide (TPR) repeat protein
MSKSVKRSLVILIYLTLALAATLVFFQVRNFDFINYDDGNYVTQNQHVLNGLTADSIKWAFTTGHAANWHPLTWLSLMLDCQLFGNNPGPIHLINLLLHIASTLLLFTVLKKMTASIWPSAFVAALFAIHPAHVESVAWIAERKDVLSTLFWMLTLLAYVGYVRRPAVYRYALALVFFALGLMAKPMLVTLPVILLPLDYWPLNRLYNAKLFYKAVIEKIPFFALSAISSVITFFVQRSGGAMIDFQTIPLSSRIANAFLSYFRYIGKLFWPQNLAVFYPFDVGSFPLWQIALCALLLIAISVCVIYFGRKRKYLLTGWFWFVAALIPVIGLVQVGPQAFSDRYTYVPYIGLFIMLAWGFHELVAGHPYKKIVIGTSAAVVLIALAAGSFRQTSYWKNSFTLFSHAVEVTQNNYTAQNNLAQDLLARGKTSLAIEHLEKAIQIKPDSVPAHVNLGAALQHQGKFAQAVAQYNKALELMPDLAQARYNLAVTLISQGKLDEALDQLRITIRLKPDWTAPMNNLAWFIAAHPELKNRDANEAVLVARRACELTNNRDPDLLDTLAASYAAAGRFEEAVNTAQKALQLAETAGQSQIKSDIQSHLVFYMQGKPYIQPSRKSVADPNKP